MQCVSSQLLVPERLHERDRGAMRHVAAAGVRVPGRVDVAAGGAVSRGLLQRRRRFQLRGVHAHTPWVVLLRRLHLGRRVTVSSGTVQHRR